MATGLHVTSEPRIFSIHATCASVRACHPHERCDSGPCGDTSAPLMVVLLTSSRAERTNRSAATDFSSCMHISIFCDTGRPVTPSSPTHRFVSRAISAPLLPYEREVMALHRSACISDA
jgi:hypothetical protein